jgi:hypothetical protein
MLGEMMTSNTKLPDFKRAALSWYEFGFSVIPIIPGTKLPAVKWDPWLDGLSPKKIRVYPSFPKVLL